MKASHDRRRGGHLRSWAATGSVVLLGATLAACGGSTGSTAGASSSSTANAALTAEVAKLTQPLAAYPIPTTPVTGVDKLKGKTVYYIPITQQASQFTVTQKSLTTALDSVGVKLQVCDGKGTPTDVSACITQAIGAGASSIITDAVPYVIATNAFAAAEKAKIPVVISNQAADPDHPASAMLDFIPAGGSQMQVALAKWVALDSGGKANVLVNESTDGPSPATYVAAGKDALTQSCPGCTMTINQISSANFALIPAATSSALLKNANVNYVQPEFEQYLQPTQTGVQQAGKISAVKGLTGAAQLGGLQALASKNFLYAAAAQASSYQGYVDADAAIRLMLGTKVPDYTIPVRLFTRDTIGSVPLTDAAQQSGEWFGPTTFPADFAKLWSQP